MRLREGKIRDPNAKAKDFNAIQKGIDEGKLELAPLYRHGKLISIDVVEAGPPTIKKRPPAVDVPIVLTKFGEAEQEAWRASRCPLPQHDWINVYAGRVHGAPERAPSLKAEHRDVSVSLCYACGFTKCDGFGDRIQTETNKRLN